MSNEPVNHGQGPEFEREDLSTRGVFGFMIGLAIFGVIVYFIIIGMYHFLDNYEKSQTASASPLAPTSEVSARHIPYAPGQGDYVERKFKENGAPLLEIDEKTEMKKLVTDQEKRLNSYRWVDERAGVAQIPIEQAMDLIVAQGLPVLPQGAVAQPAAPVAEKAPAKKASSAAPKQP